MNEVAHYERAPHARLGHREDDMSVALERPRRHQLRVGLAHQCRTRLSDMPIEQRHDVGAAGERLELWSAGDVELGFVERHAAPQRNRGDVLRQLPERIRLLMRLPVESMVWYA